MDNFTYAHNDTSGGERKSVTAKFNKFEADPYIQKLRASAFSRSIPTADDETLKFLVTYLTAAQPERILELGSAVGISGSVMLKTCANAHLTTVEKNADFYREAVDNFTALGLSERVTAVCGDAGEVINTLEGGFDFILMDCAKVQYVKYLPRLKELLNKGGTLFADDVLLFGWLTGEAEIPAKRKMLARHIGEYIDAAVSDRELITTVLNIGDGVALSVKR